MVYLDPTHVKHKNIMQMILIEPSNTTESKQSQNNTCPASCLIVWF